MLLYSSANPMAVLLAALALDLVFDSIPLLRLIPRRIARVESLIALLDRRLNRAGRNDAALRLRGTVVVLVLVLAAAAIGEIVRVYLGFVRYGWIGEAVAVALMIEPRRIFAQVSAIATALQAGEPPLARQQAAQFRGRDPGSLDDHGVARVAIEALFDHLDGRVIAPCFWYLLFGLPGLFLFQMAQTLDHRIGHRTPRYLAFGWAAMALDALLTWFPARLTGVFICLAALFVPHAHAGAALWAMLRDARKHRSLNDGWPEAAAAGALGLALGGPRQVMGTVIDAPWLGTGRARVAIADIGHALQLYGAVGVCLVVLLLTGAMLRQYF